MSAARVALPKVSVPAWASGKLGGGQGRLADTTIEGAQAVLGQHLFFQVIGGKRQGDRPLVIHFGQQT